MPRARGPQIGVKGRQGGTTGALALQRMCSAAAGAVAATAIADDGYGWVIRWFDLHRHL